ncbi:zinc finger protein on ecdysone puffs-like [Temnothorax longispinosus]|uniref:zinc finger protein on ecdysone puffs-like n=1 Tax=Temnothorax longispinosus TaxID=300112 RepID=UPI003A99E660
MLDKLKVDLMMRHELRVAEEQRELSLNNSKRRGKKVSVDFNVREYCTMCDLNFYGTLFTHRKSEKHQQLKTFLHPRCFPCLKEFPSRIEYDEHCLTPAHMKNAGSARNNKKNKKKDKLAKVEKLRFAPRKTRRKMFFMTRRTKKRRIQRNKNTSRIL